ncbi:MAG: signal peptidase II [Dehalococcoidia bacterium]
MNENNSQNGASCKDVPELDEVRSTSKQSSYRSSWRAFRDPLLLGVLFVAIVADQLTKQLVLESLGLGASWPNDGFFRFTFVRNDGTAFGLFQDNGTLLTFISLAAVALIVFFYREIAMASWFTRVALGLQLGGACGNIIDRFRHGYVVDFIDVGAWPIFNIADSAIMTGIVALITYFLIFDKKREKSHAATDIKTEDQTTLENYRSDSDIRSSSTKIRD